MNRCRTLLALLWVPAALCAQVRIDNAVQLQGDTPSERQLHGLSESTAPQAVLTADVESSGSHRSATTVAGPLWIVDLPSLTSVPTEGLHLLVRSDGEAEGPLSLQLNGSGPYPIIRGPLLPLQAEEVPIGTVVSLVFDGTSFQVLNGTTHLRRNCPTPMVQVNAQFCIEPAERDTAGFFNAALTCQQLDRRLCTWGEYIVACQNAGTLGVQAMVGNFEWTNNAANEDNSVRVAGLTNCQNAGVTPTAGTVRNYRCCFTR